VTSGRAFGRGVRREFFDRVLAGAAPSRAAVDVGICCGTGRQWWAQTGLMKQMSKDLGSDAGGRGHRLCLDERITIMRGRDTGLSCAEIGRRIGRDRSVVWREIARNTLSDGDYHAGVAHAMALGKSSRPKAFKLRDHPLCGLIETWMDDGWSPRLIAGMLARAHPDDKLARVSHETIYKCLYVQTRGSLRADLHQRLSTKRAARKPRGRAPASGTYPPGSVFTISDRPAEADDRAVPGHWEGDLILGAVGRGAIGTLVERSTRFTILLHLPKDHGADAVAAAMIEAMAELPDHLRRSITWDRGSELAQWKRIHLALQAPVYFCNPHSPWQRGTNENTNRLLRFWFEKGSDLTFHTKADLKRVQDTLNKRPRPTLDLDTPADRLAALLDPAA
jgi:transposase, IS30 family